MYYIVFIKRVDKREMGREKLNYVDNMMNRCPEGSTYQAYSCCFLLRLSFLLIKEPCFFIIFPLITAKLTKLGLILMK